VQLTSRSHISELGSAHSPWTKQRTAAVVVLALVFVFWLDRSTDEAPVQHLYYAPIILAAVVFGRRGGVTTSLAAVVLYHLANPATMSVHYREGDAVQVGLFIAVGLVTARLVSDGRRLRHLAMTDDLTGLHNLRSFEASLDAIIGESMSAGASLSMLVIDVDRLKSLNDAYGHLTGAEAVREVGHVIASSLEGTAVACRYGGDEFAVLLPGYGSSEAVATADRLRDSVLAAAPALAGRAFPAGTLSVSVGVATRSFEMRQAGSVAAGDRVTVGETLFHAADRALYRAKESGRNRVVAERWEL
jgi:diguanylate cyclase (GGDEF)-like protein